jgi:hypothetical protein
VFYWVQGTVFNGGITLNAIAPDSRDLQQREFHLLFAMPALPNITNNGIVELEQEYLYSSARDFYGRRGLLELTYL